MRVLIVGCGYVGMALAERLVREGHEVTAWRRRGAVDAPAGLSGVRWVAADITRPESLPRAEATFDAVVNTVASTVGGVEDYQRVYLDGTRHLLAWLRSAPPRQFIYTSSTGVYGQDDGSDVDENGPTQPAAATARVLVEAEQELFRAHREQGFPAIVLRLAGIYGPGRGYWMRQFLAGEARIEGDGGRILNMIHRDDVANTAIAVMARGRVGEAYNVVDDEPVTQLELFRWLATRLGRPMPPVAEATETGGRRRGVTNKRILNRKLRNELGARLDYPTFREGYAAELAALGF